jgi:hypothetical protein
LRGHHAQAECDIQHIPATITFDRATIRTQKKIHLLGILKHEMIHQAIAEFDGPAAAWDEPTLGHHQRFADICNRIAREEGWKDCYVGPVSDPHSACHWPNH